jgi:hypothetical protein
MKKFLNLSIVALLSFATSSFGQPIPDNNIPEGFISGQVILQDNSTLTAVIKDNIRKKGEVIVLADGKKTRYKANDLKNVRIGGTEYITNNYGFYEVIWQGSSLTLLRKANEPNGIQYTGNEPIAISSQGSVDDYFIKKADSPFQILTKKNVIQVLKSLCVTCASANTTLQWDIAEIKKAVAECDKCK